MIRKQQRERDGFDDIAERLGITRDSAIRTYAADVVKELKESLRLAKAPMNDEEFKQAMKASGQAAGAAGALFIHSIALLARQGVFDVDRFVSEIEQLEPGPDALPIYRETYVEMKKVLIATLRGLRQQ